MIRLQLHKAALRMLQSDVCIQNSLTDQKLCWGLISEPLREREREDSKCRLGSNVASTGMCVCVSAKTHLKRGWIQAETPSISFSRQGQIKAEGLQRSAEFTDNALLQPLVTMNN